MSLTRTSGLNTSLEPVIPAGMANVPDEIKAPESDYRREAALGLPHGSVRALLAIMIAAGIWAWLVLRPDTVAPAYLRDLMLIIMGHYFAARSKAGPSDGPAPLYLPRGSVRAMLMLGFVGVGAWLYHEHRLISSAGPSPAAITLILLGGFLLGVLVEHLFPRHIPRIIEDVRAVVSLAAGVGILLLIIGVIAAPGSEMEEFMMRHSVPDVLAGIVGFYFGSRS